jgi:[1-hydroxy-2-(trimethylamino)ethyl]phosphonate dioxygenase
VNVVDAIFRLFAKGGDTAYFGEAVTQTAHALQTAHLAEIANAPEALVVAALVHDVGHLLHQLPETIAEQGIDARHEDGGAIWLARYFSDAVVDPVRLHVAAKRFLCARDPTYLERLSPASRRSLELQGGPFTFAEISKFEGEPHYQAAVALRRWDDQAKVPALEVPGLNHYRSQLEATAVRQET